MINLKFLTAAALLSTAVAASPSIAQEHVHSGGTGQAIGARGGGAGGVRMSGGPGMSGSAGFRANGGVRVQAAQPMSGPRVSNPGMNRTAAVNMGPSSQRFVASNSWNGQRVNNEGWNNQGNWGGNWNHHRRFNGGPGIAFGFGVTPGYYGYDNYAYDDGYYPYGDTYAYYGADDGYVGATVEGGVDASYCAQRYRSYDPASGTFLGYDGLRHPCP